MTHLGGPGFGLAVGGDLNDLWDAIPALQAVVIVYHVRRHFDGVNRALLDWVSVTECDAG